MAKRINERLSAIEQELREIREMLQENFRQENDILEPRDISFEQAEKEIAQYFREHHGENIDYVDLIHALNVHLPLIVEVCAKLEKGGKIAAVNQK